MLEITFLYVFFFLIHIFTAIQYFSPLSVIIVLLWSANCESICCFRGQITCAIKRPIREPWMWQERKVYLFSDFFCIVFSYMLCIYSCTWLVHLHKHFLLFSKLAYLWPLSIFRMHLSICINSKTSPLRAKKVIKKNICRPQPHPLYPSAWHAIALSHRKKKNTMRNICT